uniref:Eukaryotic translation initiation factor 2A n=1 Tax=Caenorhabditis japonica TaxID=281687 RepID=A0A8R1I202_CAEJA
MFGWYEIFGLFHEYSSENLPAPHLNGYSKRKVPKTEGQRNIRSIRGKAGSLNEKKSKVAFDAARLLFLINLQSGDQIIVPLDKQGPVYAAKWNPNSREFVVCYGYMPAKVTFYNTKGEPTFDLLEGPRNDVFYNAFGNIVLVCGFGNISKGKMEFWDVENKKEIISIEVPNTTLFDWAPDGQHFVTCTTAPRLRIDNSYRFWHYTGRMLAETHFDSPKEELWEVRWRPMSGYNKFAIKELTKTDKMAAGLPIRKKDASHPLNNVPAGAVRQAGAYVPPHLRKPLGGASAAPAASANGSSANQNQRPGGGRGTNGNAPQAFRPQQSEQERKLFQLKKKVDEIQVLKDNSQPSSHLFRTLPVTSLQRSSRSKRSQLRNAIYTMLAIVTSYLVCNGVHLFLTILERFDPSYLYDSVDSSQSSTFYIVLSDTVSICYMISSAIRIFIYAKCNPKLRQEISDYIQRRKLDTALNSS